MANDTQQDLVTLTAGIVSAYVANSSISVKDLGRLISSIHAALAALDGSAGAVTVPSSVAYPPAVSIRKSLADRDKIVSLIDGKAYSSLKRHLAAHGLTPDAYRARYTLPTTYPMVAPGYSERRSDVAKRMGLGRKSAQAQSVERPAPVAPVSDNVVEPASGPKKRAAKPRARRSDAVPQAS